MAPNKLLGSHSVLSFQTKTPRQSMQTRILSSNLAAQATEMLSGVISKESVKLHTVAPSSIFYGMKPRHLNLAPGLLLKDLN